MSGEMWIILIAIGGSFIAQSLLLWMIYDLACAILEAICRMRDEQSEQRRRAANKPRE